MVNDTVLSNYVIWCYVSGPRNNLAQGVVFDNRAAGDLGAKRWNAVVLFKHQGLLRRTAMDFFDDQAAALEWIERCRIELESDGWIAHNAANDPD